LGIRQGAMENLALTNETSASFWRDKLVLLTGHTGFKGSWLTLWLHRLGARLTGIRLPPTTAPNLNSEANVDALCQSRFCNICDESLPLDLKQAAQSENLFYLAAQALVHPSYRDAFFSAQGVAVASARVGGVIGGDSCSENRLFPVAVRACLAGQTLEFRRARAIHPWQYVLESPSGYLILAQRLWYNPTLAIKWPHTVSEVSDKDAQWLLLPR
jgi:hypothetical protein